MTETVIKFTRGVPPAVSFPTARLSECAVQVLSEFGSVIQQYGPAAGFKPLRQSLAAEHASQEEQVLIGQGSLQLFDLAARLWIQPGELAYVELPTYDRTLISLRRAGANVIGFKLGADGPEIAEIEARLRSGERPRLMYVIPDFQNPSGSVMSTAKRRELARLSAEYGFWLVEDSPYRILRYRGEALPSLHQLAPERVILMSSFSKTICPGVRVGYMVLPAQLAKPLAKMAEDTYINTSYITQAMVFDFMRRGWASEHLASLKQLYCLRLEETLSCLDERMSGLATWTRPDGGFFVGLELNRPVPADCLVQEAHQVGLELTDGRGFFSDGGGDGFVRLPFCGLTPAEIHDGIDRLARVVSCLPETG